MSSGISPSPLSRPMAASVHQFPSNLMIPRNLFSCPNPNSKFISFSGKRGPRTLSVRCNSSIFPRGPGSSGDGDSRSILDAFFLGKALAEAVNERIESTVGEVLSTVGRLQAEQQKQVQDFQEQVLERAKKAKEKAAREAMEAQGLISMSTAETRATGSAASVTSPSAADAVVPSSPSYSVQITAAAETDTEPTKTDAEPTKEEPALGSSKDD